MRFGSALNRPGWKSPLLGQSVGLDWLDDLMNGKSGFEWVKGQDEWEDGWRDKKLVVLEFWTSWVPSLPPKLTHLDQAFFPILSRWCGVGVFNPPM